MLKKLMIAAVAAGAVATSAPVAHAEHATVNCDFDTVAQETATGGQDTFTGVARGFIVSPTAGESVSIRCYVRIDGSDQASTPTQTGTTFAATAGPVTYTATDLQDVDLCAEWTAGSESDTTCVDTTVTQIPPQPVIDLLDQVFQIIADATAGLDPTICGLIKDLGAPAIVNAVSPATLFIDPVDCDIYLLGERFIDFVPYGDVD